MPQSDVTQISRDTQANKSDSKGTGWRKVVIALAFLPAGHYIPGIGLCDYQTGVRLQTDSGDRFQIAITVEN